MNETKKENIVKEPKETFQELKNKVEAVLFATGKWVDLDEISKLVSETRNEIKKAIQGLMEDYKKRETSLKILEQNEVYKLSIREKYADFMQSIVPNAELSRPEIETLAIVAWKQPVLQSQVIDIRSQSAYAHIANLLDKEFIKREKKGRTYVLETTPKFLEYFDLPSSKELKKDLDKIEKDMAKTKMIPLEIYSSEQNDNEDKIKIITNSINTEEENKLGDLEIYDSSDDSFENSGVDNENNEDEIQNEGLEDDEFSENNSEEDVEESKKESQDNDLDNEETEEGKTKERKLDKKLEKLIDEKKRG